MADKEVPELTEVLGLDGTEEFHVVDADGNSRKLTIADLKVFVNTDPTIVPSSVPWEGARVYRTTNQTGVSTGDVVAWQAAALDTNSFWSAGAPTRLTVPVGVTKVRVFAGLVYEAGVTAGTVSGQIWKNGSLIAAPDHFARHTTRNSSTGLNNNSVMMNSGVIEVSSGDYFEAVTSISMAGIDEVLASGQCFFEIEVIEATP